MAEKPYYIGSGAKPQSLDDTIEDFKKIGKGLLVGETADILGLPADLVGLYYDVRYGETPKGIQTLIDKYGSEALAKKFMGEKFPEYGMNLESFGRTVAPGALLSKGIMTARLMARGVKPPPSPPDDFAFQTAGQLPANNTYIMDVPKTTGEKLAMTANKGIGDNQPPKKSLSLGPKNFEEAGEKFVSKGKLPGLAFRSDKPERAIETFVEEQAKNKGINPFEEFFSPTVYFLENSTNLIGFGRKPKKGIDILNSLITNPKVPRSVKREIRSLGIDNFLIRNSETPFTRDALIDLFQSVKPSITVETFSKVEDAQKNFPSVYTSYSSSQRSSEAYTNQKDYGWMVFSDKNSVSFGKNSDADLAVTSGKASSGVEGHDYAGQDSPGYFGHIRYSIQEIDGERVLVPEEIQADAVRNLETIDKIMSDTLPVKGTPTRRVSEADRKNLDRANSTLADELRLASTEDQPDILNNVDLTDRNVRFTKYGGPEEVLLIKQAQNSVSDNLRKDITDYARNKQQAVINRRISKEKLDNAEVVLDSHLRNKNELGRAVDFLDSAEVGVEAQRKFIKKLNEFKFANNLPPIIETLLAPSVKTGLLRSNFVPSKDTNQLLQHLNTYDVDNFDLEKHLKFKLEESFKSPSDQQRQFIKFAQDLPFFQDSLGQIAQDVLTANVKQTQLDKINLGGHHLNIFDIGFNKPKSSAQSVLREAFGLTDQYNYGTVRPSFLSSIRLLDPDNTVTEAKGSLYKFKDLQENAIKQDPENYVSKMKQVINKELTNKAEVELSSAKFLNTLFKDTKFMNELERSSVRLNEIETMPVNSFVNNNIREELKDILDNAVEFSFSDNFLNKLSYKLVDESYNRTNFYPSFTREYYGISTKIFVLENRSEEMADRIYEAFTPFVEKNIFPLNSRYKDEWKQLKNDPTERHSLSWIKARLGKEEKEFERLMEKEFFEDKKLQRDISAYDLKEAVLNLEGGTANASSGPSGIANGGSNAYYLGMRGERPTRGALHSVLGKLNLKDFDTKEKAFRRIRDEAEDKTQEAERIVSNNFSPEKTKENYQKLVDGLPDNKSKELLKKTIEKIIDYDLDVPGTKLKKQPPFKSMEDFSKFAIRAAVKEARKRGINKIIVPTAENYVREAKVRAIGTYNKAPKEAMQEYVKYGGKLSTRKLPEIGYDVKESNVLDISDISDEFFTDRSTSLFSKGGIVRKAS